MKHARLEHPKKDELEQGAIFNCVLVDDYNEYACHGIVLTARCDLAHGKASSVNYLPIVPIHAWLRRDALTIVAKLLQKTLNDRIFELLRNAKVPSDVIQTYRLTDVIQMELNGKSKKIVRNSSKASTPSTKR